MFSVLLGSVSPAMALPIQRHPARTDEELLAAVAALRDQDPWVYEPFTEDLERWTTGNTARSSVAIQEGVLRIRLKRGGASAAAFTGLALDNFLLELTATHHAGSADYIATVLFRIQDPATLYAFQLRGTGEVAISRVLAGQPAYLAPPATWDAIQTGAGASNRLGILADGAMLTFLVNDTVVYTLTDDAIQRGTLGLGLSVFGQESAEIAYRPTREPAPSAVPESPTAAPPVASTATPAPTSASTPTATPVQARPLTLDDLPFDWSGLEANFIVSNIRLNERTLPGSTATYMAVVFDVEAKSDLGLFVYMANFYDASGEMLNNVPVEFSLDPAALGFADMLGGWNSGAYGRAVVQLPGSLSRVHTIRFVRIF
ncbi:MAG: hypothetical protein DCC57_22935 [Chloroflexi bacterium]|nr:MAG: hypothetical protein DCC57_22935 [Chloroflexota bacterium]